MIAVVIQTAQVLPALWQDIVFFAWMVVVLASLLVGGVDAYRHAATNGVRTVVSAISGGLVMLAIYWPYSWWGSIWGTVVRFYR